MLIILLLFVSVLGQVSYFINKCHLHKWKTILNQALSVNLPIYQLPGVQPAQIPPYYQQGITPPIGNQQGFQGYPYGNQQAGFIGYQPGFQQGGIQGVPIGSLQNYPIGTQQSIYTGVQPGFQQYGIQGIPIGSIQGAQQINPQASQYVSRPAPGPITFPRWFFF